MIFHEKFEMVFSNAQKSLDQRQVLPQHVSQSFLAISNWLKDSIDNNLSVKRLELINHIVLTNFETYFNDCIKSSIDEGLSFKFEFVLAILSEFSTQKLTNIRQALMERCSAGLLPLKYIMIADKYIKCNLSSGHVIRIMTNNFETYKRQLAETSTLVDMRLDMLHFFNKGNRIIIKQQDHCFSITEKS